MNLRHPVLRVVLQSPMYFRLYYSSPEVMHRPTSHSHLHVDTGWPRPIGCLKLQVILRKRATRALLRKMTCKDKASYGSSPPFIKNMYGLATISRLLKNLGLFCRIQSLL